MNWKIGIPVNLKNIEINMELSKLPWWQLNAINDYCVSVLNYLKNEGEILISISDVYNGRTKLTAATKVIDENNNTYSNEYIVNVDISSIDNSVIMSVRKCMIQEILDCIDIVKENINAKEKAYKDNPIMFKSVIWCVIGFAILIISLLTYKM